MAQQPQPSLGQRVLRSSAYAVGASLITLTLGLVRSVVLARLLVPEHFGVVALALFYIGLAAQLRGIGLDAALIHRQQADRAFMRTYFGLRLGLDALAFGILLALVPLLQHANPHSPNLSAVLVVLTPTFFFSSLAQVQETLARKQLAFRQLATTDVAAAVAMTVVAPALAWLGWGVWALVAEQVVGIAVRFLLLWGPFRKWTPALGWDGNVARWLWRYGKPTWAASNMTYLLDRFDDFWIGTWLGEAPLGLYSRAYEFAHYPRRLLANPLVSVFAAVFAQLQDDRLRLSRAFARAAYVITRTSLVAAGGFALVLPEFIHFVIGDQWQPMLVTFWLMLIYAVLDPVLMLIHHLLLATGHPQALQRANFFQLLFFAPAVVLLGSLWGINGVALAADGMLVLGVAVLYPTLKRLVDFSTLRLLFQPLLVGGLALAAAWFLSMLAVQSLSLASVVLRLGLFAGLLLLGIALLERDDLKAGVRELRSRVWVPSLHRA